VLRKIFGHKKDDVTEECGRYNEGFHDLYSSTNVIGVIK
jgi:hypothetical protein